MRKGLKMRSKKKVKGLSPIIATVLLIVLVVSIALIVFLWVRGMTQEAITKFGGSGKPENIQLVCNEVSFEASYTAGTGLYITNPGSVPIFGMNVKEIGDGSHKTVELRDNANWPTVGLNQGGVFADSAFSSELDAGVTEIVLVPVLIGESDSGRKTYVCDENQYGYQIMV
jgi:flagellin-like protein